MIAPLVVFALTYLLIAGVRLPGLRLDRTEAALVGAVAMVAVGGLPLREAYAAINLDTLCLLLGMMVMVACLAEARFFDRLAWETIRRSRTPRGLLVGLVVACGALAALLVNDTICLLFTPLVVAVVEAAELPALPYLMAITTASNIGGVATYTGNPQNMIVGTHAGISFARFSAHMLPVAALGLAADALLLLWIFGAQLPRRPLAHAQPHPPTMNTALVLETLGALAVAVVGFLWGFSLAGTALAAAALLLLLSRSRESEAKGIFGRVDFPLLVFFAALFVVVAGVAHTGALARANATIAPSLGTTAAAQVTTFSLVTVVGSNLFSNVPFVLLGLDTARGLADPALGYLALAMASTLAGNLTIVGSVANLIVLEQAGRHGKVGFVEFLRHGVPITAVTLAIGVGVLLVEKGMGW